MNESDTPAKVGSSEGLGAGSEARPLLDRCGRQKGNRWFVQHGARTYYGHGFRSKAEADEWIDAHRRAGLMDWRVGYRFRLRGNNFDVQIVNRHGEPASA
ncbi:MAG: hypothetical protein AB7F22_05190 [Reyranella sp.]|uniref:hypothetical protein n=1 Tax=Reyranella sp. TaxID=1929291 RepID=UPI003D0CD9EF